MSKLLRKLSSWLRHSTGSSVTLILLFVVLVPSLCLVWFMNQAMRNEGAAVRQKLVDAYRAQLDATREQFEASWQKAAAELDAQLELSSGSALFARLVTLGAADSVICYSRDGHRVFPVDPVAPETFRPSAAWLEAEELERHDKTSAAAAYAAIAAAAHNPQIEARALQAQTRCLYQTHEYASATSLVRGALRAERFNAAVDPQGRRIVVNVELMALEAIEPTDAAAAHEILADLAARLRNYDDATLPSSQRRFLMRELARQFPRECNFPTLAAEDLASAYLDSEAPPLNDPNLRATTLAGVWQNASRDLRVVLLHRAEHLPDRLRHQLSNLGFPADVYIEFVPPGHETTGTLLSIPAGAALPGWHLALLSQDPRLASSAGRPAVSSYVWIAILMVLSVVLLASLAWGLVRRQIALTQLRNELVANVTHELKTPLASMRLLVETLLNRPTLEERTTREYLQLIATENIRLNRLIGNFLTFSRIERNKYAFEFEAVSAQCVIATAAEAVRERLQSAQGRFTVTPLDDTVYINADADALATALINLLDNAWKYTGYTKQIELVGRCENEKVYFAVRDNGVGISPRDLKRVFHRFYQAHDSRSTAGGGCGLGLSIVDFIVSAHRGEVRVESEVGHGSTFTIVVPALPHSNSSSAS